MVCVCKLIAKKREIKKKKKGRNRIVPKTVVQFFLLQGGSNLFLNYGSSLSMSKFLHLLFSCVISCFKK